MAESQAFRHETHGVDIRGIQVFVDDGGPLDGPCVLFSHSIMTSSAMWKHQLQLLRGEGYRAIAYDARGHGRSSVSPPPYDLPGLADDVAALLDALRLARVHFVGLSLGGMVAFDLMARYPQRLLSAMICDARADAPEIFARPWDERIGVARSRGMQALAEPTTARWFGADFRASAQAGAIRALICETPVQGFIGTARAIQSFDYRFALARAAMPVTLLCGENDASLLPEMAALAAQISGAVMETTPGAGHLPNVENPLHFDAALLRHLARGRN